MKFEIYNQQGKKSGDVSLPEEIFGVAINENLIHQVVTSQASNRRQNSAHSKDRGAVAGTGKKPWKQKGTGRARAGSVRSPLWRKGGITFGPSNERNYKMVIPTAMSRKALFMVLAGKAADNELIVIKDIKVEKPKTKEMVEMFKNLPVEKSSILLVVDKNDKTIIKSVANLNKVSVLEARNLNVLDILNSKYLVITESSIEVLKKTFLK